MQTKVEKIVGTQFLQTESSPFDIPDVKSFRHNKTCKSDKSIKLDIEGKRSDI